MGPRIPGAPRQSKPRLSGRGLVEATQLAALAEWNGCADRLPWDRHGMALRAFPGAPFGCLYYLDGGEDSEVKTSRLRPAPVEASLEKDASRLLAAMADFGVPWFEEAVRLLAEQQRDLLPAGSSARRLADLLAPASIDRSRPDPAAGGLSSALIRLVDLPRADRRLASASVNDRGRVVAYLPGMLPSARPRDFALAAVLCGVAPNASACATAAESIQAEVEAIAKVRHRAAQAQSRNLRAIAGARRALGF